MLFKVSYGIMNKFDWTLVYRVVKEKFVLRKAKNEIVIVPLVNDVADMTNVITLNEVATDIIEKIDGVNTVEQIVSQLLEEYDVKKNILEEDISNFIIEAKNKGIIQQVN